MSKRACAFRPAPLAAARSGAFRPGTEPLPAIAALGAACAEWQAQGDSWRESMERILARLRARLVRHCGGRNPPRERRAPHPRHRGGRVSQRGDHADARAERNRCVVRLRVQPGAAQPCAAGNGRARQNHRRRPAGEHRPGHDRGGSGRAGGRARKHQSKGIEDVREIFAAQAGRDRSQGPEPGPVRTAAYQKYQLEAAGAREIPHLLPAVHHLCGAGGGDGYGSGRGNLQKCVRRGEHLPGGGEPQGALRDHRYRLLLFGGYPAERQVL